MNWERMTAVEFESAPKASSGVCLLPMGVIEKHGNHLPLGQDTIYIHDVCTLAADVEPAVVFPFYYFGQIHEARHVPGTVAIDGELLVRLLRNVCDEIARNGFSKIVLVNGHGGNNSLIQYFLQLALQECLPYTIYASWFPPAGQRSASLLEATVDGHAGEVETSSMLHLHPELVHLEAYGDYGRSLGRLDHLKAAGVSTGIWWYAEYPGHLSAEKVPFTAEKGKALVEDHVDYLANQIRVIKSDVTAPELTRDFYDRNGSPSNRYP